MSKPETRQTTQLLSKEYELNSFEENTFQKYQAQIESFFESKKDEFGSKNVSCCFILHDRSNGQINLFSLGKVYCYFRLVEKRTFARDRVKYVLVNQGDSESLSNVRIDPVSITREFTRLEGKNRPNQFDQIIISAEPFVDKMKGLRGYRSGIVDGVAFIQVKDDECEMTYQKVAKTQTKPLTKKQVEDIAGKVVDKDKMQKVLQDVFYKVEGCPLEFVTLDLNHLKKDLKCYSFLVNRGEEKLQPEEIFGLFQRSLIKADSLENLLENLSSKEIVRAPEKPNGNSHKKEDRPSIPDDMDGLQVDKYGKRLHYKKTPRLPSDPMQPKRGSLSKLQEQDGKISTV